MPLFVYKARDKKGALITGEMEAVNVSDVKHRLADQGLFPTLVDSKGVSFGLPSFLKRENKVKTKDLIAFTRQFAALFKAGIPMDRLISTLIKQSPNKDMQGVLEKIYNDISGGSSLAKAFAKHPAYFNDLYVNMINVGEQAGMLDKTLTEMTKILQNEHRVISNVKSATLYPKIVLFVFAAVFVLMVTYVIPRFADFYSGYHAKLPLPTLIVVGISDFMQNYWYIALAFVAGVFLIFRRYKKTKVGQLSLDKLKFKLPVFGRLNLMVANSRFARLLAALYKSGLPLSNSLNITANTIGNVAYQHEVEAVNAEVEKGSSLARAMEGRKYFTPLIIEGAAVGEQTGALDEMLDSAAQFYDDEVTIMLDQLTTLIEPLLLVGLFAMVGLLALAIFLPMWNVTKVVLTNG